MKLREALNTPGYNTAKLTVSPNGWTAIHYTVEKNPRHDSFFIQVKNQDNVVIFEQNYVKSEELEAVCCWPASEYLPESDQWKPINTYFGIGGEYFARP